MRGFAECVFIWGFILLIVGIIAFKAVFYVAALAALLKWITMG